MGLNMISKLIYLEVYRARGKNKRQIFPVRTLIPSFKGEQENSEKYLNRIKPARFGLK